MAEKIVVDEFDVGENMNMNSKELSQATVDSIEEGATRGKSRREVAKRDTIKWRRPVTQRPQAVWLSAIRESSSGLLGFPWQMVKQMPPSTPSNFFC